MLFTQDRAIMKTAYLACLVLAATTHYYAFAASSVLPGPLTAVAACTRADLTPQACLSDGLGHLIGFNLFLRH